MIALTIVGVIPFVCMGLALALLVPFSSAPGITNMIYLPMSFCGGLWVPLMFLPHFMQNDRCAHANLSLGPVDARRLRLREHWYHFKPLVWASWLYTADAWYRSRCLAPH
jgi:hypothetical protein